MCNKYDGKKVQEILDELYHPPRQKDMPRRVKLCGEALALISRDEEPDVWGQLQDDLACSLLETTTGSPVENIEQAILHFEQALEIRTYQKYPKEWAMTKNNLARAYLNRILGIRADNLEKAINLYEQTLQVRTRESDLKRWAMIQYNLAGVYLERIREDRAENLEKAILHANQALEIYTREALSHYWALTQNTLGEIYRLRIHGSRTNNIECAIYHYNQALEVFSRDVFPTHWAMIQQNLGNVYTVRLEGTRVENIEQAIHHCQLALEVYTREAFPRYWASIQYNLGNAYRERIRGDRAKNTEQAIWRFRQALAIRTRQASPEEWARTQSNLGSAYLARIRGERKKNIERAINHCQQALEVFTYQSFPEDWARTCNNLGNAYRAHVYSKQAEDKAQLKYIDQAIFNYKQALLVRTHDTFPEDWAETLSNLAGAECMSGNGTDLEHGIQHLQLALSIYTRDAFPQHWARTHNNLAIAYKKQNESEESIQKAIGHYNHALEVYTPQTFPYECLNTARGLGKLAFDRKWWDFAKIAYDKAFEAQDVLMQTVLSFASEKTELVEVQNLPPRAAYAHLKSAVKPGDINRAVELMEKGRAQLLRESFELQHWKLERLQSMGFGSLYNDYILARNEYRNLQNIKTLEEYHDTCWEKALNNIQIAEATIREVVGKESSQYRYFMQTLPFDEIQKQAFEKPLVYLCATSVGGLALIVSKEGVQVLEIPELEQEALQKQIWRPTNEEIERINTHIQWGLITPEDIESVKSGFFSMYALWSLIKNDSISEAWKETLDETTHWLWDTVMGRLIPILKDYGESAVLIPSGQLALLPLHAAWTDDPSKPTKRRYVLDELNISYVPSAHALRLARLAEERPTEYLLLIDNPDGSLKFVKDQVQAATDKFPQVTRFLGKNATVAAVKKEMQKAHVLHFATHGRAGWEKSEQAQLTLTDGVLTLPDIFALDLNFARLAVLSACETGVPGLELIDEMIGLPAGMLQAGVPGVIGSLWSVDDASTAILMSRFYEIWREEGKTPQDALRQAQCWLRDNLYESPYYWAAFTYTGV